MCGVLQIVEIAMPELTDLADVNSSEEIDGYFSPHRVDYFFTSRFSFLFSTSIFPLICTIATIVINTWVKLCFSGSVTEKRSFYLFFFFFVTSSSSILLLCMKRDVLLYVYPNLPPSLCLSLYPCLTAFFISILKLFLSV